MADAEAQVTSKLDAFLAKVHLTKSEAIAIAAVVLGIFIGALIF